MSLGIFYYANDAEDLYPNPIALLQVFIPKWFEDTPDEGVLMLNMQDIKTRNITLEEVIDTFNNIGLEVDQKILYNMHDKFLPLFDLDKNKKTNNKYK